MNKKLRLWLLLGLIITLTIGCVKKEKTGKEDAIDSTKENHEVQEKPIKIPVKDRDFITIKSSVLNVRTEPSKNAKILGKVVQGQDFTIEKITVDDEGRTWYGVTYKDGIGYLAGWYCIANKSQNIDLRRYSSYNIQYAKWMDEDIIILLKEKEEETYKLIEYDVVTKGIREFYLGSKELDGFWDAKNLDGNIFGICLTDRILLFDGTTLELTKEVILRESEEDTNDGIFTQYDLQYDGSIVYINDYELRRRNILKDEDTSIYQIASENRENYVMMKPRWSAYGTKVRCNLLKGSEEFVLIMDKQGGGLREIPMQNINSRWIDDKYLYGYSNTKGVDKGYIINSATGKVRTINLKKYVDQIDGTTQVENSSLVALYSDDDIYIVKDMASFKLLKYSLPFQLDESTPFLNQIGSKIICMQIKKHSIVLYHLGLYE